MRLTKRIATLPVAVAALLWTTPVCAQSSDPNPAPAAESPMSGAHQMTPQQSMTLSKEEARLRRRLARLEMLRAQDHQEPRSAPEKKMGKMTADPQMGDSQKGMKGMKPAMPATGAMGGGMGGRGAMMGGEMPMEGGGGMPMGGGGMGGMGGMTAGKKPMGGGMAMKDSGMGGMSGMMGEMSGMEMMGRMPMPAAPAIPSDLPGFPGASHLYHIGATGFFLDHPEAITLTPAQQGTLQTIKDRAILDEQAVQQRIDKGEQDLWAQTGAERPDSRRIEAEARKVEKLKTDQRLAYIRAVGSAARVLTDAQRASVLGHAPAMAPQATPAAPGGMSMPGGATPPTGGSNPGMGNPGGGMGDM